MAAKTELLFDFIKYVLSSMDCDKCPLQWYCMHECSYKLCCYDDIEKDYHLMHAIKIMKRDGDI